MMAKAYRTIDGNNAYLLTLLESAHKQNYEGPISIDFHHGNRLPHTNLYLVAQDTAGASNTHLSLQETCGSGKI